MPTTPTIYQASDLNQRYRVVLDDAARDGYARVRDKDGKSFLVTPEESFKELEERSEAGEAIASATATFVLLEQAVGDHREAINLSELGDWVWVRHLPTSDLGEFIAELREALYTSCRELSIAPLRDALDAWRETALTLSDPLSRATLLSDRTADDYVDAARPELEDQSSS